MYTRRKKPQFLPEKAKIHNSYEEYFPLALLLDQTSLHGHGIEFLPSQSDTNQLKFGILPVPHRFVGKAGTEGEFLALPQPEEGRDPCGALSDGSRGQGLQPDTGAEGCEGQVPPSLQEIRM